MKVSAKDLKRIAECKLLLESLPNRKCDADNIAAHLGMKTRDVERVLADPVFDDLFAMYRDGKFAMWAGIIADAEEELSKIVSRLGYKAILRLNQLIDSEDEKVAGAAIRTALEYNSDLERPVVRHEITTRFTPEEIDKARDVVRLLKNKITKLPEPVGPPN